MSANSADQPATPEHLRDTSNPVVQLFARCWRRLNVDNEHFILCIVGREGIGKSHTAISIAEKLDPNFTHERVLFSPAPLLERLRDGDYQPGQMFVVDEAGVSMGRRTWHDKEQVKINQALQLIRSHNLGLIFTLPRLSELDSQTQGRLHAYMELVEKQTGEFVRGPWYWMDPDRADVTGKIYRKYPRINGKRLEHIAITPPSDDIVEAYEQRKQRFQQDFYDEVLADIGDDEGDDESAAERAADAVADAAEKITSAEDVASHLSWHGGHHKWVIDKNSLRTAFDLTHSQAKQLKKRVRSRDGIDIQAIGDQHREEPA